MRHRVWASKPCGLLPLILLVAAPSLPAEIVDEYLDRYFATFPTAATAAGRHDLDGDLERLDERARTGWVQFNHSTVERVRARLADPGLDNEDKLDLELLLREAQRQVFDFEILRAAERDPLFWTGILGNATVFLLVRDDTPLQDRLTSAAARADLIPRLAAEAGRAMRGSRAADLAPELLDLAVSQARATADFYRHGFFRAAPEDDPALVRRLRHSGEKAADALSSLAMELAELQSGATGSFRLAEHYPEKFRLVTGIEQSVAAVLADAQQALARKVEETAAFGREIWPNIFPDRDAPLEDRELIRALFDRLGEDRAVTSEELVDDYRWLADRSVRFVREKELMTLPEPLTLMIEPSPSFFLGQSVGGVYPAGPFAPAEAKTLLFVPTPADEATPDQRRAFFRDFNHHFNVMITPHELIPGHYVQLKWAARQPRKVRALFGDGVYIEGWGTFAERLMLDLGWGGDLARMAHLKKQLENIARTIVDIQVHTRQMTEAQVLSFVQSEALQDEQFARNMWRRAMTSSPQLVSYYLGYREVWGLYEEVRAELGAEFDLKSFMDGMMALGPVAVRHYRQRMLGR